MMLTFNVKHCRNFCEELKKARQIAEFALMTRSSTSSDVKHFGLKSMIANQILRKYGRNKKAKRITHVNLIIPNQGIVVDKALKLITLPCLKLKLNYYFSGFEKINQIEIDDEYAYITTTRNDADLIDNGKFIGVVLNTTGHVAVVSSPETGKVCKLGKEANHIALKYRAIRRSLQKQGKYRKVKQMKNRQQRLIKNLNHHISRKIVQFAGSTKSGIRLEKLTKIRQSTRISKSKSFRYCLNNWSFYQLQKMIEYKAKLQGITVFYIDPRYTSKTCSKCGHIGDRENKSFKCPSCGHVEHADANASFNIGKSVSHCILSMDQLHVDRDACKGSSDTPKVATS
jgi:putative transposase